VDSSAAICCALPWFESTPSSEGCGPPPDRRGATYVDKLLELTILQSFLLRANEVIN
jgi:hypothetical protein